MKRLHVVLVAALLAVSLAAFAQVIFDHQSWEFPRIGRPTLYIEVYPNGKLMLYEEDVVVGMRYLRCSPDQ